MPVLSDSSGSFYGYDSSNNFGSGDFWDGGPSGGGGAGDDW